MGRDFRPFVAMRGCRHIGSYKVQAVTSLYRNWAKFSRQSICDRSTRASRMPGPEKEQGQSNYCAAESTQHGELTDSDLHARYTPKRYKSNASVAP